MNIQRDSKGDQGDMLTQVYELKVNGLKYLIKDIQKQCPR
jgi:hypothetical protein